MPRVCERRRHTRLAISCPAAIRDRTGRLLLRGRAADITPCGVRILGSGGMPIQEGQDVWVELTVRGPRPLTSRPRIVKVRGQVRRVQVMGSWRSVLVVIFDTELPSRLLDPML